jgi:hypothetical protein
VVADPLLVLAAEIMPQAGEHEAPFCVRVQLTFPLLESLLTVPATCNELFTCTVADVGERATTRAGTVIVAEADFVESATALALSVTVRSPAGGPGAV